MDLNRKMKIPAQPSSVHFEGRLWPTYGRFYIHEQRAVYFNNLLNENNEFEYNWAFVQFMHARNFNEAFNLFLSFITPQFLLSDIEEGTPLEDAWWILVNMSQYAG